ncbi:MAG: glutamate-1-semialdehyde 2,1-aminomutase [Bacteroidia bacterium]|nr:glutamate-1-semialdehyde 2,1-aminomutase [Bacteroidia bacterium]
MKYPERHQSAQLFEEAKKYFPGGVHSPVRAFKSVSGPPLFIKKGSGCRIVDEDDNTYLDFCGSWGPLILGHAHPDVINPILETMVNGTSFGTPNKIGNELGKIICENNRYLDKIRFVSSGTEAVMSAIRLARGITGKSKIIKFEGCYHGHVDSLLVKAGSGLATFGVSTSAGIPPSFAAETIVLPLNDLDLLNATLSKYREEVACVIIEPIPANNGLLLQTQSYLASMRDLCTQHGVLLIFDEVISGYRVGFEGAAGYYNIQPDIITYGKIIGGGMPVGAYAASKEYMSYISPEGPVYQAGTLSANPVAMAAGLATLKILKTEGFYLQLEQRTADFVGQIQSHCDNKGYQVCIQQIGSIFWISFSKVPAVTASDIDPSSMELFKNLHSYLLMHGIYLGPSGYEVGFVSGAHKRSDLSEAAGIICSGLDEILS